MIYLNNAATTFPKFNKTLDMINFSLQEGLVFCNRDSVEFIKVSQMIFELRQMLGKFIGAKKPYNICFTTNDTLALNMVIQGLPVKEGQYVLYTSHEHNSVSRPLVSMERQGKFRLMEIPFFNGELDYKYLEATVNEYKDKIAFGVFTHASNVTGDLVDIVRIGKILKRKNIPFVLDAAQSIGVVPIDVEKANISALTFAGHKFLNGPQGTGGFYLRKSRELTPILFGGTGNNSMELEPHVLYPDSFEVGTPAVHDILGLYASLKVIVEDIGEKNYAKKILYLSQYLRNKLEEVDNIIIYGDKEKKSSAVSFNIKNIPPKTVGEFLGQKGIVCRTGAHCAALAVRQLGVKGTVRLSCGYYNTRQQIDYVVRCLKEFVYKE